MPNTITVAARPTSAKTAPPTLSKADAALVAHARDELTRTDGMITEILQLKDRLADFGRDYATGKINILQAASLLPATTATARAEITSGLRHSVKTYQREILQSVAEVVTKAREHAVAELLEKCRTLELVERDSAKNIGITADNYEPSPMLRSLRQQHKVAVESLDNRISRADLNALS